MNEGYSLADIRAATEGDGMGFGGGNAWVMIILFALIFGNGFGGFGGRGSNPVTEADLCSANSFSELKGSVGRLSDEVAGVNSNLQKGICDLGYETLRNFNDTQRQISDCCCTTQRGIDSVKFDMANYVAASNANVNAGIQKVLDKLCEGEKAQMAARIQQLELQQAVAGVVRYPTSYSYSAGASPFCGGGVSHCCGYNGNI